MFVNRMRLWGTFTVIGAIAVASLSFTAAAPPDARRVDSDEIRELLAQRVEILKERMEIVIRGHESGAADFNEVHKARREHLNAKLDLSANIAERIEVLKEIVDSADTACKTATEAFESLTGSKIEVLKAKADVLEARVALARAELEK